MWLLLLGLARAATLGAAHHGTPHDAGITWESAYAFDVPEARLTLAVPLPPGTRVEGAEPTLDPEGRIAGLSFAPAPLLRVRATQPGSDPLVPPIASGAAPQRVTVAGGFVPDPALGLTKRLGGWAHEGVDRRDRTELARRFGAPGPRAQPMWITAEVAVRRGGLTGRRGSPPPSLVFTVGVGAAFVATVAALVGVLRGLDRRARHESALAYLDTLSRSPPTRRSRSDP